MNNYLFLIPSLVINLLIEDYFKSIEPPSNPFSNVFLVLAPNMAAMCVYRCVYLRLFLLFLAFSSRAFIFTWVMMFTLLRSWLCLLQELSRISGISHPIYKLQRHGHMCFYLPPSKDIAVCMDVERNPGPTLPTHYRGFAFNGNLC